MNEDAAPSAAAAATPAPIRVLVVDDHTLFRRGLIALLGTQAQLQVVGEAADASAADGMRALPVDQTSGTPMREQFNARVLDKSDSQLKAYWSRVVFTGTGTPPKEVGGDNEVKKLVADNPNLIGYIDKTKLDSSVVAILSIE